MALISPRSLCVVNLGRSRVSRVAFRHISSSAAQSTNHSESETFEFGKTAGKRTAKLNAEQRAFLDSAVCSRVLNRSHDCTNINLASRQSRWRTCRSTYICRANTVYNQSTSSPTTTDETHV